MEGSFPLKGKFSGISFSQELQLPPHSSRPWGGIGFDIHTQNTPGVMEIRELIPCEEGRGMWELLPAQTRSQNPHQSPGAGRALPGHPESVPWVQIQGFPIGKVSPTPDGPKCGSDVPCVLLDLKGKSPGTGQGLEQPHGWGQSWGSPPPVPSLGSSTSARKKRDLGTQRPPGAPWASPQNLTPPLCAQKGLGWSLGGLGLLLTSSSINPMGQSHIWGAPETPPVLPTSQTRRKIGFEQQTGADLSPVPVPLSLQC